MEHVESWDVSAAEGVGQASGVRRLVEQRRRRLVEQRWRKLVEQRRRRLVEQRRGRLVEQRRRRLVEQRRRGRLVEQRRKILLATNPLLHFTSILPPSTSPCLCSPP
eukprot:766933-Hanusia_phi.AAC.6